MIILNIYYNKRPLVMKNVDSVSEIFGLRYLVAQWSDSLSYLHCLSTVAKISMRFICSILI